MTIEQPERTSQPALWALLVGINTYRSPLIGTLRGCVNDVQAMEVFLLNQLNVPKAHIRTLTDAAATRAAILREIQSFLIDNPAIKRGDQILFHYSGHGSRMRCPAEWDAGGYVEALVPHDSRTADVYDIPDKTLAALLDRLAAARGDQITIIFDSCHSGSGTRDMRAPGAACARRAPDDERLPPADLDADLRARAPARNAGPSGLPTQGMPYVLLAGCRDMELSNEYWGSAEDGRGVWHGALTYFALQALRNLGKLPARMSYAELHEWVAAQVSAVYPTQMPQCEGEGRARAVFEGVTIARDSFIAVEQVDGDMLRLGAGLVHGLRVDTELALYPPDVRTRDALPAEPICAVRVVEVSATRAQAIVISPAAAEVPQHARAIITRYIDTNRRLAVALLARGGKAEQDTVERLRELIRPTAPDREPSPYLEPQDDPARGFDMRVVAEAGQLSIYGADDQLLVMPQPITGQARDAGAALGALESIARYRTLLALTNEEAGSQLAGTIKLRLRRYVQTDAGPAAEDLPGSAAGQELTLFYDPADKARNVYVVDVINESAIPVYAHVFIMNPDYSIRRLYPNRGQQSHIRGAENGQAGILSIGLPSSGDRSLEIYLPDHPRWDSCHDHLKVIVTTESTDLRMLEQRALSVPAPQRSKEGMSPLNQLLRARVDGTRFGGPTGLGNGEDWATAELPLTVVRAARTAELRPADRRVRLGDQIVLEKPAGFTGTVTITTMSQATRGEVDDGPAPPPALERFPERFQRIGYAGARGIGPSGLALDFAVDEASRASVTPDSPLQLELPAVPGDEVAELLPVVFDGEDYLFVGHSAERPNTVTIVALPQAAGAAATRGGGRAIRLFVYKKLGRHAADLGLRAAELIDGHVVYRQVEHERFQPGQHVALFIHGFTSDTAWMVRDVAPFLRQEVIGYDHLLTFDYESFGTTVKANGEQLALTLERQCGFGPADEITLHVYAHSMGSVVARCMIELCGGHAFVDRLVMAGPPNRGTTLATSGRGLAFVATELLNNVSAIPPLGAANWLLKQLYEQGLGLADLAVDSQLLNELNALEQPSKVPYLVLAGENSVDEAERSRLKRLAHKLLDTSLDALFGEQNDSVIGRSSMLGVRGGAYPALHVEPLGCNHHVYYHVAEGRAAIKRWMAGEAPHGAAG